MVTIKEIAKDEDIVRTALYRGCGGNMFPEDHAARYRLYQFFLHDSQKGPAEKIAVGTAGTQQLWGAGVRADSALYAGHEG